MRKLLVFAASTIALLAGDYNAQVGKFRADREKSLISEDGWTTVVGLSWLKEGGNRAGSDSQAEVPLPASVPAQAGVFTLKAGHVRFQPSPGVKLPAKELLPNKDVLTIGTVRFFLIQRGDKFGIRVKIVRRQRARNSAT